MMRLQAMINKLPIARAEKIDILIDASRLPSDIQERVVSEFIEEVEEENADE